MLIPVGHGKRIKCSRVEWITLRTRPHSEVISASMVTICNGACTARLRTSLTVEPLEDVRSMSTMPAGLTKHDCVINAVYIMHGTPISREAGIQFEQSLPRIGAL
jgi:hypothetical protein